MQADLFPFELTRPAWLAGLLALPVFYYFYRCSLSEFARGQRRLSLAVRVVIVVLLVLSLAGFTWVWPTQDQYVVLLVDRSLSVDEQAARSADEFVAQAIEQAGTNRLGVLPFAKQPGTVAGQLPADGLADGEAPDPQGTDIAAAIQAAAGAIPPGYVPHLVLLSDGNQTSGDGLQAAWQAAMPVSVVLLATRTDPEVQVSAVRLPAQVREGEPFHVEVVVDSNHDDTAVIKVYRGAHLVIEEPKPLERGENRFRFTQTITGERMAGYTARIESPDGDPLDDTLLDNNAESGLVFTAGQPRVLIVESDPRLIREMVSALAREGIRADVRPPAGMPESLADLQNYEMLVLSNVPATALTQRQMEIARTYVQDLGGGLMMLGGEQSFGLGGYYKTVLEDVLPVRSDFEKQQEKPNLAMALVIDKSGSMDGDKVEMAKSAARSAVDLLGPRDQVGVIAFDGETYVISEMQSAAGKGRIGNDISRIEAGGGTVMYPAMQQAYDFLRNASARLKHVIILTDGVSSPDDFEGLAQSMAAERITVTTVAIGTDADTDLLERIAQVGRGRYYWTDDPSAVPQIFAKETVTAGKSAIDEQPFVPQTIRATQALQGIDLDAAPFLLGYVRTRPKPTSEVVLATEQGDPLLAWWRYGLGMSVAFTSDAKSRWSAEWLTWSGYSRFWAQVIRHAMRRSESQGVQVEIAQQDAEAVVTVDAVDPSGRFLNDAETELVLIDPRLGTQKLELQPSAPGRYTARFPTPASGEYHLEISQQKDGHTLYRQSRGLTVGYNSELRLRPTDEDLLRSIAEVTGGRYQPTPAECFTPWDRIAHRPEPIWPWLIAAAAMLLVLDVALRRVELSVSRQV